MITSSLEIITPEKAKAYLEMNTNNYRSLSKDRVRQYADDIRLGKWALNGESIVFSADGVLKDGQHRLAAIVEANKAIMVLVVRGVENDVNLYDVGAGRTLNQIVRAEGNYVDSSIIAAANILQAGFFRSASKGIVKEYIYKHMDDLETAHKIATAGVSHAAGRKVSCCLSVYGLRKFGLVSDDVLSEFFWVFNHQNIHPEQKRNPSPALVAIRQFSNMSVGASGRMKKFQMAIILQALRDYQKNKNRTIAYYENDKIVEDMVTRIRKEDGIQSSVF